MIVIINELECPTSGDYLKSKLILVTRDLNKITQRIVLIMGLEITLNNELIAQLQQRAANGTLALYSDQLLLADSRAQHGRLDLPKVRYAVELCRALQESAQGAAGVKASVNKKLDSE